MSKKNQFLFLDRDGVINKRLPGAYVTHPNDFIFCEGTLEALAMLAPLFERIVVVTNQAGIGKGLMNMDDLETVHQKMFQEVIATGGRIDRAYCCPNITSDNAHCRKPNIGMGLQALADFPGIDFKQSWMVGDSASDIEFGKRLGMKTALVEGKTEENEQLATLNVDWRGASLLEFTQFFCLDLVW